MKKIIALLLVVSALSIYAGNPKAVMIGVKNRSLEEYTAVTILKVTFKAWLAQGNGAAITSGQILQVGSSSACITKMVSYRGTVNFDLQHFDTWGLNNIVNCLMKDENGGLKAYYEGSYTWLINDTSITMKRVGLNPLDPSSGDAISISTFFHDFSNISENLPLVTKLHQNYPNPFNPTTSIKFDLASTENVKLNVYSYNGQLVKSLVNGQMEAGFHSVNFDASSLSAGVYYYSMEAEGKSLTEKMVLVK